ncbi:hypothetical protein BU204_19065 [Actinophytocola xanthii]|uniref:Uncharacterized protein n=1 Tax=Actinophytocola xanthii TaxID=1912961 RepID=A0A1Q8CNR7_9PSEU|nr:hypothetical protein BU204_19065 [Actinophytocola xanthii]
MPDTSEAAYRGHVERWHLEGDLYEEPVHSSVEPLDGTWFDWADSVQDTPLILLVPRDHS